ncbi:S-adenosylmethionine:tRNA ribosyltransferase-isomerase [archaeon BMS3Abin16]|nr:S-adenosylmethionine:tRNA ribosyltransferase-isomerase [archaeon BMS3Abin16]
MDLTLYDYSLPRELVAQQPALARDMSRLLVLDKEFVDDTFVNLPTYFSAGDVLVLNDSRVVMAQLVARKKTSGRVEILIIRSDGVSASCLLKGKKIHLGTVLEIGDFSAVVRGKDDGRFNLEFDKPVSEIIERHGQVPLPQYIKEKVADPSRYQTVYCRESGSVAAPTAGLHFTEELLAAIHDRGVEIAYVTLHIGPSTFLPLREGCEHPRLEPEIYSIDEVNAEKINQGIKSDSLITVGTTTVKALESANTGGVVKPGIGQSSLFIAPGHRFKTPIKSMVTNFHLPKSSLLLLVCALFGRERILNAYEHAVNHSYRFYSFGDAMLILR